MAGKTKLEVSVHPRELACGEEVRVHSALGEPDARARSARVRLVYVNSYRYRSFNPDGSYSTRTRHKEVVVAEEPLALANASGLSAGSSETVLRVPGNAPPTVEDTVRWMVKVTVDRKAGRDVNEEIPLTVASAADAYAAGAHRPGTSPSEARMDIQVDRRSVRPGERISGSVAVTANEDLEARALRVRLKGRRSDQDGECVNYSGPEQTLVEPAQLGTRATQSFPFTLEVPAGTRPSFRTRNNRLNWHVEVFLDRRMRSDPTGRLEVVILRPA